jgi:DNA-binding NtrC family response regulator
MSNRDALVETVTEPVEKRGEAAVFKPARLCVVHPAGLRMTLALDEGERTLGRTAEGAGSVALAHRTVSRRHFAIAWDRARERHTGFDLGSRNGSRVSGQTVSGEPIPLDDGAVLRLGDVVAIYERSDALAVPDAPGVDRNAVPGQAAAVRRLRNCLAQAGPDPSTVLIVGETGTGKELIARELHRLSGRAGPFVPVNCSALSPQLIESQLFGHQKGAFTGAQAAHDGLFRAAEGGTLFLDEVGELPAEMQPKLLRVLQEGEVLPVGHTRPIKVDVRVIAATLRDLGAATEAGSFRMDLYARLRMWEIHVPALRERRADVLDWLDRLLARWHEQRSSEGKPPDLDTDAVERLLLHRWPDNLRGLDRLAHRIGGERIVGPIGSTEIDAWLPPVRGPAAAPPPAAAPGPGFDGDEVTMPAALPKPTREELERVLAEHGGSVRATARHFGRDRRQIYRWLEQYGLRGDKE